MTIIARVVVCLSLIFLLSIKAQAERSSAVLLQAGQESLATGHYEATAQLMSTLKTPGVSKAKALQQAEISLLKQQKFSNPCFWSPFILVGIGYEV
jgi:hypothetical protein